MKCPKCGNTISELDEKCPVCGLTFDDYEEEKKLKEENKQSTSINIVKRIVVALLSINFIFMLFLENYYIGIGSLIVAIVVWTVLTAEEKKINLLQEISEKLDK
jgi:uncharacterized membrane protein YvbJ|nr:MAG TPA: zinc-ribbon containing domain protein [Caudoviricetes sp.]